MVQHAAPGHGIQGRSGVGQSQDLEGLVPHPLAAKAINAGGGGGAGGEGPRLRRAAAEAGLKAKKSQDTQLVFGDPLGRITDETDAAPLSA